MKSCEVNASFWREGDKCCSGRCAMAAHDAWFYSMHRLFHQVLAFAQFSDGTCNPCLLSVTTMPWGC